MREFLFECAGCKASGFLTVEASPGGFLACPDCGGPPRRLGVANWSDWIQKQADEKQEAVASGRLGTRKQDYGRSDRDIDVIGTGAELAACLAFCPDRLVDFKLFQGPNRGRDFPREWTGLQKPIEVKHTKWRTDTTGYLLVRPPRMTPGKMRQEYIDNSFYVLLTGGSNWIYQFEGWADRQRLIDHGQLNPVPKRERQRECWGIHWSKLLPLPIREMT